MEATLPSRRTARADLKKILSEDLKSEISNFKPEIAISNLDLRSQ